jgi:hypothetical protein
LGVLCKDLGLLFFVTSDLEPPNNNISSSTRSANQQQQRQVIFCLVVTAISISGMVGAAAFGLLAGGKLGLGLTKTAFEDAAFASVDIVVRQIISLLEGHLVLPAPDLLKRACCWLVIGILHGSVCALYYILDFGRCETCRGDLATRANRLRCSLLFFTSELVLLAS